MTTILKCLAPQHANPRKESSSSKRYYYDDSKVAELRAVEMFKKNFLARFPDGYFDTEFGYIATTTIARSDKTGNLGIKIPQNRGLTRVLQGLAADFRRHKKDRDFRKPDAFGLWVDENTNGIGELMEVTTVGRTEEAAKQLRDKLDTLTNTVNRIHNLNIRWVATGWRPLPEPSEEAFYSLVPDPDESSRYVCFQPTYRMAAPLGVILYEIHSIKKRKHEHDQEKRRAYHYRVKIDPVFDRLVPVIRPELPNAIREYDPEAPYQVIIVPQEFYRAWQNRQNRDDLDRKLDLLRVHGSGVPGVRELHDHVWTFLYAAAVVAGALELIVVGASAVYAAAAGGGTAIASSPVVPEVMDVMLDELAVLRAKRAAELAQAVRAAATSSAAKNATKVAAGILLVVFSKRAQAASPSIGENQGMATITASRFAHNLANGGSFDVSVIRAVAVTDFHLVNNNILSATSTPSPLFAVGSCYSESWYKRFSFGTKVLFDGKPHIIIGHVESS